MVGGIQYNGTILERNEGEMGNIYIPPLEQPWKNKSEISFYLKEGGGKDHGKPDMCLYM